MVYCHSKVNCTYFYAWSDGFVEEDICEKFLIFFFLVELLLGELTQVQHILFVLIAVYLLLTNAIGMC